MNFRLDNNSYSRYGDKRAPRFPWKLVAVAIIVLLAVGQWLFGFVDSFGSSLLAPLWEGKQKVSNALEQGSPKTKADLVAENRELAAKVDTLTRALASKDLIERENRQLQSLLHRVPSEAKPLVGKVVSRPDQSPYDILVIDVGSANAGRTLEVGSPVVIDGILLGSIADVGRTLSKVRLLSSPGVKTAVEILGTTTIPSTASGLGGGNFEITLPRGLDPMIGDPIVHASSTNKLLGTVEAIDNRPDEPYQVIRFRSPVNFFMLEWVEIYGA